MTAAPGPPRARLALAVAGVALLVAAAAAAGIPVRATYGAQTSGDEPHYLVTALSLGEDGSLDVADEQEAERYREFHEPGLRSQAARQPDGRMVVPHDPLLPALLALPMLLGGWVAAKAVLAGLAGALAGLLTWTMVRRFGVGLPAAVTVVAVCGASAPLAVYGTQVYPELPAAVAVAVALAAVTGRRGPTAQVALGLAIVALPWLSVKYVPVAAALAGVGLVRLWRDGARLPAAVFTGALVVAGAGYVLAHLHWYGGVTSYAAGRFFVEHGGELSVLGTDPQYLGRSRRLLGLLVGRWFGLAAWQPAWLLVVPAGAALLRTRPPGFDALVVPFAAGWASATWLALTMQGFWFPGRQVVVVLPAAVVALGWWAGGDRRRLAAVAGAGLLGVVGYGVLVAEGWQGALTWVVDFHTTAYPWYRLWRQALPDYLTVTAWTWVLHGVWLGVVALLAAWGWRGAGRQADGRGAADPAVPAAPVPG